MPSGSWSDLRKVARTKPKKANVIGFVPYGWPVFIAQFFLDFITPQPPALISIAKQHFWGIDNQAGFCENLSIIITGGFYDSMKRNGVNMDFS